LITACLRSVQKLGELHNKVQLSGISHDSQLGRYLILYSASQYFWRYFFITCTTCWSSTLGKSIKVSLISLDQLKMSTNLGPF